MTAKDYFSGHAKDYAKYRPDYPQELFNYLVSLINHHDVVWDCATGNGQAAVQLAKYFNKVVATDVSAQQIQHAQPADNIFYQVGPAEKTNFADYSVDMVTVAQALHWFNLNEFYQEVRRVVKPNGVIAAWCYDLFITKHAAIDKIIDYFYYDVLSAYWDPARRYIDEQYATIAFPFPRLSVPAFYMERNWNFAQLLDYLNTWSALKAYLEKNQQNPLEIIKADLQNAWGDAGNKYKIIWPVYMLVGKL